MGRDMIYALKKKKSVTAIRKPAWNRASSSTQPFGWAWWRPLTHMVPFHWNCNQPSSLTSSFTGRQTEAQRSSLTSPRPHIQEGVGSGIRTQISRESRHDLPFRDDVRIRAAAGGKESESPGRLCAAAMP